MVVAAERVTCTADIARVQFDMGYNTLCPGKQIILDSQPLVKFIFECKINIKIAELSHYLMILTLGERTF